jgi:ribonuclease D
VRYLPLIHAEMKKRLQEQGHLEWMRHACDEMCAEAARPVEARKLFSKIRGAVGLNPQQLSVLREVTSLREQIAYEHDVPARAFLKDEVLLDLALKAPRSESDLARIRDMPAEEVESYGPVFLEAIAAGIRVEEKDRPSLHVPGEDSAEIKRLGETLWVAAQVICLGQSVTPALVTSQSEILALARLVNKKKSIEKHPLMTGWHKECLGEKLAAFIKGELQIDLTIVEQNLRAAFEGVGSVAGTRTSRRPPA